jgi:REP element-mobilizing transposase RayT
VSNEETTSGSSPGMGHTANHVAYFLQKQFPQLEAMYWKNVLWSRSYFAASCGGAPLKIIRQYVEQQKVPD